LFNDVSAANAVNFDFGTLYVHELSQEKNSKVQLGASFNNFSNAEITWVAPDDAEATNEFPMVFRIGAAYKTSSKLKLPNTSEGTIAYTISTQYQTLFNSDFHAGYNVEEKQINDAVEQMMALMVHWELA
jgi:hypothetical protein